MNDTEINVLKLFSDEGIDIKSLLEEELEYADSEKIKKDSVLTTFSNSEFDFETLEKIDEETKLLFPSYLIRLANYKDLSKSSLSSLKIMMENGSYRAYKEYKKRCGNDLTEMSDEFLIIAINQGNCNEELEVLTIRYKKFIEKLINMNKKKYGFRGFEREDLIQEANIGLLKAVEVFKVERRTKFKDFSKYVIDRHLGTLMYRSKNLRNKALINKSISYNSPVLVVNSSQTTTFEEMIEGETPSPYEVLENKHLLKLIKSNLKKSDMKVLIPYADGYSYEEIAFKLMVEKGAMDFRDLSYHDVSNFLKVISSRTEFESRDSFEDALHLVPYAEIIDNDYYLCGYHYQQISTELKKGRKSVDNTIQRMKKKGIKQRYSFENDGKVLNYENKNEMVYE